MQADQDAGVYWNQTPRIIVHVLSGYRARMRIEHESTVYHALLSENLARWPKNKRLPTLKALTEEKKAVQRVQAPQELLSNLKAWGQVLRAQMQSN